MLESDNMLLGVESVAFVPLLDEMVQFVPFIRAVVFAPFAAAAWAKIEPVDPPVRLVVFVAFIPV